MIEYNPILELPRVEDLPCSDETPVDSELQILIPTLLQILLSLLWTEREDWFFGLNMGIYHTTGKNPRIPIVPDGFLSIGVSRRQGEMGRLSYITWKENNITPILTLEYVSQTYGGEYDWEETNQNYSPKMRDYARLGVLYYIIYNPNRYHIGNHHPFEVYRLVDGNYLIQKGEPVWMPEIGLGIGRERGIFQNWEREWLYWYNKQGERYQIPEELWKQERQRAQQAEQKNAELEALLQQYQRRFGELPKD